MGSKIGIVNRVGVFRRREFAVHVADGTEAAVGVAAGVDLAEFLDVDVGVNLGRFHPGVAEHFLHVADVGTAAVHVGGARMSPEMAGAGFVDAAAFEELFDPVAEVGGSESFAVAGEEEGGFLRQVVDEWARLGEEAVEPGGGALADGQHAVLAVLALADEEGAGVGIVVAVVELGHFAPANAGGVEEFEDGAVAQAEGIGGVGDGEKALDFVFVEGFGQAAGLFAREVEIGGGVGGDAAGSAEPGEEAADATESSKLGVGDERLAAARAAVVVKEMLIGFEIDAGEGGGIVHAARGGPCGELPQRPAVGVDGGLRVGARGEIFEEGFGVGGDSLRGGWLRGGCATLAAAAHGAEVGESGFSWHDSRWIWLDWLFCLSVAKSMFRHLRELRQISKSDLFPNPIFSVDAFTRQAFFGIHGYVPLAACRLPLAACRLPLAA